jgi:hypothetical protein
MTPTISRDEWLWAAIVGVLIFSLASLPYAIGWLRPTPGAEFGGFVLHLQDGYSYLAKMRLGARGLWLYRNMYAVEPHPGTLLFTPFILMGKLAALAGGGARVEVWALHAVFHLARVVACGLLGWALYRFYAVILPEVRQRRLAYALALAGSGLGWLLVATGQGVLFGDRPLDLYLGEAYGFIALLMYPHVALARACLLLGVLRFARVMDGPGGPGDALAAGGLWLVTTLCVPFYILVAGGVVGGWLAVRAIRSRRVPLRAAGWGLVAGLPGAAIVLVNLALIGSDPVYAAWNAQNLLPLPHPAHFVFAFGIPLVLGAVGAQEALRRNLPLAELCIGWPLASAALILLPLNVQLRLLEGAHVPLWGLAVLGLEALIGGRVRLRRAATAGLLVVSLPSAGFLVLGGASLALFGFAHVYVPSDEAAALRWLNAHAPFEAVVLAPEEVGRLAPGWAGVRSVLGHGFETPDYPQTRDDVTLFYSDDASDETRRVLLERYHVDYVYLGPNPEHDLDSLSLKGLGLREVFRQGEVTIYQVVR